MCIVLRLLRIADEDGDGGSVKNKNFKRLALNLIFYQKKRGR